MILASRRIREVILVSKGVEFNFLFTSEHYRVFCRSFGVENSFLCALGPKLDFLALGSYADVLASVLRLSVL